MNQMTPERRAKDRHRVTADIAIMHGEDEMLARLKDISLDGVQFEVDCQEMDSVANAVDAVRLIGLPALGIKMVWGIGDTFGAEFTAPPERVAKIVESYLDHRDG